MYERDYRKPVSFTYGDLLDTSRLETTIREFQPTAIIWLAAIVGDGACQVNAEARLLVDQQLVEWLAANYAGRIVFTSTCSVSPMTPKPSIEFSDVSFEDARNYRVDASKYTAQPGAVPFKITLEDFEFSVERL
jgi:nucleoside-diphosphate-sugar epimerase